MSQNLLEKPFDRPEDYGAFFESIYRALPDAVIFMNEERIIEMVNPAFRQLFGYKRNEILRQSSALLFVNSQDFIEQGEKLTALEKDEVSAIQEIDFRRKDDSFFTGETVATSVRDKDGNTLGTLRIVRDISQRKAAESQSLILAQERSRMAVLSKFLTDASHDFRHPLSRMTSHLYMLEKKLVDKGIEGSEKHFEVIRGAINKLDNLLDDLLLMTRLDSGTELSLQPAYLNPILETIYQEWKPKADKAHIELKSDLNDAPFARIDAGFFKIAIGHLLENAIRYTAIGGTVSIVSLSDGQNVYVHVQDNGTGINQYDEKHIWERFYVADESRNDKTSGSGLGLPIVKAIIEQHNGVAGVASELGQGSIFHITLPLWKG